MTERQQFDDIDLRILSEVLRQQLLQFASLPKVPKIRSFPVLGVSKDAPLPLPDIPTAADPARSRDQ